MCTCIYLLFIFFTDDNAALFELEGSSNVDIIINMCYHGSQACFLHLAAKNSFSVACHPELVLKGA